jgi:P pilus assembly/Cpx signaling pathway, periplasmic inhibitor/zinc-resistance associated protein
MKRKAWLITGIVALVAVMAVPIAYAQHQRHGSDEFGGFGPFAKVHWLKQQLGLTDDQASQIRDIASGVRDQNREYRKTMRANMADAGKILIANPTDLAAAQAVLAHNADAEAAMKTNILKGVSQALQVLTPEQRVKLGTVLEQRKQEKSRSK